MERYCLAPVRGPLPPGHIAAAAAQEGEDVEMEEGAAHAGVAHAQETQPPTSLDWDSLGCQGMAMGDAEGGGLGGAAVDIEAAAGKDRGISVKRQMDADAVKAAVAKAKLAWEDERARQALQLAQAQRQLEITSKTAAAEQKRQRLEHLQAMKQVEDEHKLSMKQMGDKHKLSMKQMEGRHDHALVELSRYQQARADMQLQRDGHAQCVQQLAAQLHALRAAVATCR